RGRNAQDIFLPLPSQGRGPGGLGSERRWRRIRTLPTRPDPLLSAQCAGTRRRLAQMREPGMMPLPQVVAASESRSLTARVPEGGRVLVLVAACVCVTLGYRDNAGRAWPWIVEWLAGCALLILALHRGPPPPEAPARRWARWACGALCVGAT